MCLNPKGMTTLASTVYTVATCHRAAEYLMCWCALISSDCSLMLGMNMEYEIMLVKRMML